MSYFFRLSNRQQKELLIRGQRLLIALPATTEEDADLMHLAAALLPEHASHIVSAELADVTVARTAGHANGLSQWMGEITESPSHRAISYSVVSIVVTLEHGRVAGEQPLQWPGKCIGDGWEI